MPELRGGGVAVRLRLAAARMRWDVDRRIVVDAVAIVVCDMTPDARSAAAGGATRLAPRLWMGRQPPPGRVLHDAGFQHVFLCAKEWQPGPATYPGVAVHRCGLDDPPWPIEAVDEVRAVHAGRNVASLLQRGERVLVTCIEGRNRSGAVCALALHYALGLSGDDAIARVKRLRDPMLPHGRPALANPHWLDCLHRIASPPRRFAVG